MDTCKAKINIGMPVFNGERYIESAIKATLEQTYSDFILIISDNASTDRTEEICRDFSSSDSRVVYRRNSENIGAANNYNQLFQMAHAEYFRWFNADDLCSPFLQERCLKVLEDNDDVVMCYGKTDIIDSDGELINHYDDKLDLQQDWVVDRFRAFFRNIGLTNAIYGLMRRSALEKTKLMGNATYPAADTNLMGELSLYGKFVELPETLFFRRMHEDASSWDRSNDGVQQAFWSGGGSDSKFRMPTWKQNFAYVKAIHNSPNSFRDKVILQLYMFRKIIWARGPILKEFVRMIENR